MTSAGEAAQKPPALQHGEADADAAGDLAAVSASGSARGSRAVRRHRARGDDQLVEHVDRLDPGSTTAPAVIPRGDEHAAGEFGGLGPDLIRTLDVQVRVRRGLGELAAASLARGVKVQPLSWHRQCPGCPGLVLGYAASTPTAIDDAVAVIAEALRDVR